MLCAGTLTLALACSTSSAALSLPDAGDRTLPCNDLKQLGSSISLEVSDQTPSTTPELGSICLPPCVGHSPLVLAGEFVLTSLTYVAGGTAAAGPSGVSLRQTLSFQGNVLRMVEVNEQTGFETRTTSTFALVGGVLRRTDTCQSNDAGTTQDAIVSLREPTLTLVTEVPTKDGIKKVLSVYTRVVRDF